MLRRPRRALAVQAVRVGLVVSLLAAIPSPSSRYRSDSTNPPGLELVRRVLPSAAAIGQSATESGMWPVYDANEQQIATAARTLPEARHVVGYRGPSEAMILLDEDLKIIAVRLLSSADTQEHVDAVVADELFFEQFRGWDWGGSDTQHAIDAVSGATLTSLALAEGVLVRIGGERPSLVFPQRLTVEEIRDWFPDAVSLSEGRIAMQVHDGNGRVIGRVLRSGVFSDDVIGYQGPSELLLKVSDDQLVEAIKLRDSYDNQPYVRYVRVEAGFWALFTDQTIDQLAELDPEAAGIEGVSGATMTSLAVADTVAATARAARAAEKRAADAIENRNRFRWTLPDVATVAMLLLAAVFSHFGWFRNRQLRRIWLIAVLGVIGLWSGNLISLALIAGWSAEGVAWRLAPGLTAVAAAALLIPPLRKANPYCNHLCPHGAVQQWIRPGQLSGTARISKRYPGRRATRWLSRIPGFSLVIAYALLVAIPTIDLSTIEPFHAYLFRIAAWSAIAFCIGTLAIATVIPMGYCRFGCPTGRLIDYLRRTATSDRWQRADLVAASLLVYAIGVRMMS